MPVLAAAAALSCATCTPATAEFQARVLAAHNAERSARCVPPLVWDAAAAADAAAWAAELARTHRMRHADGGSASGQGENLFMGTAGAYPVEAMIGLWAAEKTVLAQLASWEDDFRTVGHYTQMVWSGTTAVGCAVASDGADDYLVCRYSPPGNVEGEQPFPADCARPDMVLASAPTGGRR